MHGPDRLLLQFYLASFFSLFPTATVVEVELFLLLFFLLFLPPFLVARLPWLSLRHFLTSQSKARILNL